MWKISKRYFRSLESDLPNNFLLQQRWLERDKNNKNGIVLLFSWYVPGTGASEKVWSQFAWEPSCHTQWKVAGAAKEKSQWLFENCLSFTCKWSSLIPCWTLYTSTEEVIYTFSMCLGVKTKIDMGLQSVFWCINKNIHLRRSWCSRQRQSCSHGLLFCSRRFPENQVLRNCCFYLFLDLCVHQEDSQLLPISFHYKRLNMTKVEQTRVA